MKTSRKSTSNLTKGARTLLDEVVRNYREQILTSAERLAGEYGNDLTIEVTTKEILLAIEQVSKTSPSRSTTVSTRYRIVLVIGILYILVGLFIFIRDTFQIDLSFAQIVGLTVAVAGLAVSIGAYYYERRKKGDASEAYVAQKSAMSSELVTRWQEVETLLRKRASKLLDESFLAKPMSILIEELTRLNVLTPNEKLRIKRVLQMRNSIVHKKEVLSNRELSRGLDIANGILSSLRSTEKPKIL